MSYLFFLQLIYLFCKRVFPFSNAKYYVLDLIKGQVFTIGGACRHSGQCCQSIMLYDNGKPLQTLSRFQEFLTKYSECYSFVPNEINGQISSYDCNCLTNDNQCSRYTTRPNMCRKYPTSFFYDHGFIYDSCGYHVEKNDHKFKCLFSNIETEMNLFFSDKG